MFFVLPVAHRSKHFRHVERVRHLGETRGPYVWELKPHQAIRGSLQWKTKLFLDVAVTRSRFWISHSSKKRAQPLQTGPCDGGSCLTPRSHRSDQGRITCVPLGCFSSFPRLLSSFKLFCLSSLSPSVCVFLCSFLSEDFTPVQHKAPPVPKPPKPVPPYNGFGSEEDSLGNCQGLLPKPVHKDFKKFMEKDRFG